MPGLLGFGFFVILSYIIVVGAALAAVIGWRALRRGLDWPLLSLALLLLIGPWIAVLLTLGPGEFGYMLKLIRGTEEGDPTGPVWLSVVVAFALAAGLAVRLLLRTSRMRP